MACRGAPTTRRPFAVTAAAEALKDVEVGDRLTVIKLPIELSCRGGIMPRTRQRALLTAIEVADYLRIHVMTVYRMVQRGDIPAIRVGNRWRFRRDHIDRWLKGMGKPAAPATRSRK